MQTDRIKIDRHFPKILGLYFKDGLGSDGSVVKGLTVHSQWLLWQQIYSDIWNKHAFLSPFYKFQTSSQDGVHKKGLS